MNSLSRTEMQQHVTILGWIHIVSNILFLVIGLFISILFPAIGAVSGDPQATSILGLLGTFVGTLVALLGIPGIIAGYGLLRHKAWGRYLAIVVSIFGLLNFPIGTLIGVYSLWVLFQTVAEDYFATSAPV